MYVGAASTPVGSTASLLGITICLDSRNPADEVIPVACAERQVSDRTIF